jgi:hypothetical protein
VEKYENWLHLILIMCREGVAKGKRRIGAANPQVAES